MVSLPIGSAVKGKDRIVSWILLVLHALVLVISVLLLLSPNTLFNRESGLANVKLDITALLSTSTLNANTTSSQNAQTHV